MRKRIRRDSEGEKVVLQARASEKTDPAGCWSEWGVGVFRGPGSSVTSLLDVGAATREGTWPRKKRIEKQAVAGAGITRDCTRSYY